MNRYDSFRLSGHDPEWNAQTAALLRNEIHGRNVMFASFNRSAAVVSVRDLLRGIWTDKRDVIPGDFR
jgi:hypothetical protein